LRFCNPATIIGLITHDDEVAGLNAFRLEPFARFPRSIRPIDSLRGDPLKSMFARDVEECDAVFGDFLAQKDRALVLADQGLESFATLPKRLRAQIGTVQPKEIEDTCDGAARFDCRRPKWDLPLSSSAFSERGLDEALCLAIIRYEIRRRLAVPLFPEGKRQCGEPIRDTGRREHEGAGRPPIDSGPRARARYMAASCDFPGCAASADQ
jgi:hypothetical protein